MTTPSPTDAPRAPAPIADDVPCAVCGYDLRGLTTGLKCPECGHEIEDSLTRWQSPPLDARAARTLAAGVVLLELAAIVSFCILLIPVGNLFDGPRRVVMWHQLGKLALGLFPPVAGWWGAWVLTRSSASPRRVSAAWRSVRWTIRASATIGILFVPAVFAVNMLTGYQPRLGAATVPVLNGLVTLASLLIYVYLSRIASLLRWRVLFWTCLVHGTLLSASTLWSWLRGLADGLPLFLPVPFMATPVVGSGYPFALRWPWLWIKYEKTWLPSWAPPVVAVCVAGMASVFVLEALRRAFGRTARQEGSPGRTAASSRP